MKTLISLMLLSSLLLAKDSTLFVEKYSNDVGKKVVVGFFKDRVAFTSYTDQLKPRSLQSKVKTVKGLMSAKNLRFELLVEKPHNIRGIKKYYEKEGLKQGTKVYSEVRVEIKDKLLILYGDDEAVKEFELK